MTCPYLEYREMAEAAGDDPTDSETGDPRAFCTAAEEFVQPMRADVCNDRFDLDHETDCEIFREAEEFPEFPEDDRTEGGQADE